MKITPEKTLGLSPKLYPALIAIVVGLVLIIARAEDSLGTAILLTGVGGLGLGAALPPGNVCVNPSDVQVNPAAGDVRPPA